MYFICKKHLVQISRNMILSFSQVAKSKRKLCINNSMTSLLNVENAFFDFKSTYSQGNPFLEMPGHRMLYILTVVKMLLQL